jgi:3-dehydroquinate synthetase
VVVGHGLLEQVPALPGFPDDTSGRAFLAGDALALTLHGRTVAGALRGAGLETAVHVLPPGEEGKTPRRLAALWEAMAAAGLTRHDVVVSVGGGAVTDTAGFAAATYMRGVRLVHVPTTLLAQVDAAVGGKTAVNLSAGKNLAGVFHLPSLVVADVATLDTLPPELEAEGLVELVKTLLVGGGPGGDGAPAPDALLDRAPSWPDLVAAAVRIKLGIARDDLRDRGRRMILNLGHTFGHALEAAAGPGRVRHGLAVGVGIAAAVRLSERLGLLSEPSAERASKLVEALLGRFPRSRLRAVAALSPDGVLPYLSLDKKRGSGSGSGGAPVFVLLRDEDDGGVGAVPVTVPVPELRGEIERALVSALSLTRELASDKRRRWRGQGR